MSTENRQSAIIAAVERRGYREGWTDEQFAARQVAKLTEELGELMGHIWQLGQANGPSRWEDKIFWASVNAKPAFDYGKWENAEVTDADAAISELADIIVVACCLADALGEPDIMARALEKAQNDVGRGVR